MKYLYKFLDAGLKSHYDGSAWTVGKWRTVPTPTRKCEGLNASKYIQDAFGYAQGPILAEVECRGKIIEGEDKWTCARMRIVGTAKWGKVESVKFAVFRAELALPKFEVAHPDNNRPRLAIEAAKAWLADPTAKNAEAAWAAEAAEVPWAEKAVRAVWAAGTVWATEAAGAARAAGTAAREKIHAYCLSLVGW